MGNKYLQWFYSGLFFVSLKGMNFGGGSSYDESGESWVLKMMAQKISEPAIIFDGGANRGNYALMADKILGGRGTAPQIYCFEPSAETFSLLGKNLGERKNIRLINQGLGERAGSLTLYSNAKGSGLASVYNRELLASGSGPHLTEQVGIISVDDFCTRNKIGHIDLLKLDTEGHELAALRGAAQMIARGAVANIQFEFGGTDIDAGVYFRDFYRLLSPRYRIFRILKNGLRPINKYSEWDEIFITTNYYAELKRN